VQKCQIGIKKEWQGEFSRKMLAENLKDIDLAKKLPEKPCLYKKEQYNAF
jgi:hypothetical protein